MYNIDRDREAEIFTTQVYPKRFILTHFQTHEADYRGSHIESLLENLFESIYCSIIVIFL